MVASLDIQPKDPTIGVYLALSGYLIFYADDAVTDAHYASLS